MRQARLKNLATRYHSPPPQVVRELAEADRPNTLALLAQNPLAGVHLHSLIEDYGFGSPKLRGVLVGCFEQDRLIGVALLGHQILFYCQRPELFMAFAQKASEIQAKGHVIFGPQEKVEAFWRGLEQQGRETRMVRDHLWCVCTKSALPLSQMQLRRANLDELDIAVNAQAETLIEESGTDPRLADAKGFRERVATRIKLGRTWVKIQDGHIVFKAELQSVTPEVAYLEGIWTHPDYRQQGIATQCLNELVHRLLKQHIALCLVSEPTDEIARHVYEKVGFQDSGVYQARFLKPL